jgi:hypothetical protein
MLHMGLRRAVIMESEVFGKVVLPSDSLFQATAGVSPLRACRGE